MARDYKPVDFSRVYKEIYSNWKVSVWDGRYFREVKLTTKYPLVQGTVSLTPETNELGEVAP